MGKYHKILFSAIGLFAVLFFFWGTGMLNPSVFGGVVASFVASYFFILEKNSIKDKEDRFREIFSEELEKKLEEEKK